MLLEFDGPKGKPINNGCGTENSNGRTHSSKPVVTSWEEAGTKGRIVHDWKIQHAPIKSSRNNKSSS